MSTKPNKVAIVTGASRGIGRDIALRLAADGFAVAVGYAGAQARANQTVAEIEWSGGKALAVQGDVGKAEDVDKLFSTTLDLYGRVDAVVSNAGVMDLAPIKASSLGALDRMMNTSVRGTFLVLAKAAETFGEGGRVVALPTSVITKATPGYGPYIASKAAVEGLVHVLANELCGRGMTVNAVAPGRVATDLFMRGKLKSRWRPWLSCRRSSDSDSRPTLPTQSRSSLEKTAPG